MCLGAVVDSVFGPSAAGFDALLALRGTLEPSPLSLTVLYIREILPSWRGPSSFGIGGLALP